MIIMMEKMDAFAIKVFNWMILNSLSAGLMLVVIIFRIILPSDEDFKTITYKKVYETVEEWSGIKK